MDNAADTIARPTRHLIATLSEAPVELVDIVSPKSKMLKRLLKLPLVMLMLTAGIQNAFVQVCFKFFGEINLTREQGTHEGLAWTLLLVGCVFGAV